MKAWQSRKKLLESTQILKLWQRKLKKHGMPACQGNKSKVNKFRLFSNQFKATIRICILNYLQVSLFGSNWHHGSNFTIHLLYGIHISFLSSQNCIFRLRVTYLFLMFRSCMWVVVLPYFFVYNKRNIRFS